MQNVSKFEKQKVSQFEESITSSRGWVRAFVWAHTVAYLCCFLKNIGLQKTKIVWVSYDVWKPNDMFSNIENELRIKKNMKSVRIRN